MKKRAFTLLELLVVITIIGVLSSIVVVSMSGSTDSATIAKGKAYAQQVHALLGHEAVLDFNFNENAQDTCPDGKDVCDASGYNNNGTKYGAVYVSSPIDGYALYFDGVDDYINILDSSSLDIAWEITISAWVKPEQCNDHGTVATKNGSYYLQVHSDCTVAVYTYWNNNGSQGGSAYHYSNSALPLDDWSYIVFSENTSGVRKIYINGNLDGNFSAESSIFPRDDPLQIGKQGTVRPFKGLIDDVRIYSEALSSVEIQNHYVQGLKKLLAGQVIIQSEYDQKIKEFNQYSASI